MLDELEQKMEECEQILKNNRNMTQRVSSDKIEQMPVKQQLNSDRRQTETSKNSYLYDSHYIQSKEAVDMLEKIERQENRMLKSYIVQKDEETLIVS